MKNNEFNIEKICGFYVNEWHLTTMLLPNIVKEIKDNANFVNIFEKGIEGNIQEILLKMNINLKTKEEILKLNWTSTEVLEDNSIKTQIQEKLANVEKIEILIAGNEKYIENINRKIEVLIKQIEKSKLENKKIKIINCYKIEKNKNINNILNKHKFILNTSGVRKIEEVFTSYKSEEGDEIIV